MLHLFLVFIFILGYLITLLLSLNYHFRNHNPLQLLLQHVFSAMIWLCYSLTLIWFLPISTLVCRIMRILSSLLNQHAPARTRSVRLRPHSPWFSVAIQTARKLCRVHERKWRHTRLEIDRQLYIVIKATRF